MKVRNLLAGLFALAMVVSTGWAAEKIDNPEYKQWAKFKPGTWTKVKTVTDSGGNKMEMEATTKLVEMTDDKAVIETSQKMKMMGNDMDMPAQKREVPAKIDKPETPMAGHDDAKKPDVKQGEEEVTVAGQKIKCKTTESTTKSGDMNTSSKTWTSSEVPGEMVKMESKTDGAAASTTTMELVEMEIKK